jgi:hypothetical protein
MFRGHVVFAGASWRDLFPLRRISCHQPPLLLMAERLLVSYIKLDFRTSIKSKLLTERAEGCNS